LNRASGALNDAYAAPDFTYSCQASTEHFEQCDEFALLPNRRLGALGVTVLAVPLPGGPLSSQCGVT
jgi:hypothetical protein